MHLRREEEGGKKDRNDGTPAQSYRDAPSDIVITNR